VTRWSNALIAAAIAALASIPMRAADSLSDARQLYAAAEYENALSVLERIESGDRSADDRRAIEQYRAYCLLALGRPADAEQAIAAVVASAPRYRPGADASPRLRAAFTAVRRRTLPTVIQDRYAAAKQAFDRRDYADASVGFADVSDALDDPDLVDLASVPPLSDLRVLAAGFRELSVKALTPVPISSRGIAPLAGLSRPVAAPRVLADIPRIFAASDTDVEPPSAVKQPLPLFPGQWASSRGVLEVVIDEHGFVESAAIRESVNPRYDAQLLKAVKSWVYAPALRAGTPVKYRKLIQVDVTR
jgi:tetratricopeptide (TPR) repeat protein